MIDQNKIKELVKQCTEDMRCARRKLHAYPEISNEEEGTAAYMAKTLRSFGIDVQEHVAGSHGVVGTLTGKRPGPTIALRADMDALSILLGAAKVLSELRDELAGTVVFICQPAEEKSPRGGAKGLVEAGVLDGVDAIYGLHVWPTLPTGTIGVKAGPMMAASDHIRIVIRGKSSHAAMPHKGVDAIVAAGQFITAAQDIISRQINPLYPAVLTFGRISGGTRYNIVAGEVELEGTCRTYHAEAQDMVEAQLGNMLRGLDTMYGTESELHYERGYAAVVNSQRQADFVASVAADCFGRDALADVQEPAMTAEDFSGYLQACDGAFFWLGATKAGDAVYPLHNSRFAVDEDCLPIGAELMASLVCRAMENQ